MTVSIPFRAWDGLLAERRATNGGKDSAASAIAAIEARMFERQRRVYRDRAKRRAVITTRRAGKTEGCVGRRAICMCAHPGENSWSGYVTLTKGQSRRNLEGPMRALIREFSLPINPGEIDGQLVFTHANGHRLWVGGVDDLRKAERWRGNKWWDFEIDESGAWPDEVLAYMIEDVIEPGLSDTNGQLTLNGTPGTLPVGIFYEVTTPGDRLPDGRRKRPQWSTHTWSVVDNPHHPYGKPGGALLLDEYRRSKGWELDHPTYLREWCGKWASDPEQLIYRYDGQRNAFWDLPTDTRPTFVLGVDLGHDDDTAFVLTVSFRGKPHVYVMRAWGASAMTQPQRAQEIKRIQMALESKYRTKAQVVVDQGGLGKAMAYDLTNIYGIACDPADKRDKAAAIRSVQAALLAGHLLVHPFAPSPDDPIGLGSAQLLSEWSVLPWNDERTGHREGFSDHCPDALLYAFRKHPIWEMWEEELPQAGTPERRDYDVEKLLEREMREGELRQLLRGASAADSLDILDELRESA